MNRVTKAKLKKVVLYLVLIILCIFFVAPFVWMLSTSLKSSNEVFMYPPVLIPEKFYWSNYREALTSIPFFTYIGNTAKVTSLAVLGNILTAPLVGYAFAKLEWPGRDKLFLLVLATMMLPFQITMIPLYSIYVKYGLINTYFPLVMPDFFGKAYFVFLMRQFFKTIPNEMSESARIDGASELQIYTRIMLPLAKPGLVTVALFAFVFSYTDFLGPLIFLTDETKWTLSLGLSKFTTSFGFEWTSIMAASTVFTIPMIIFFFFMQKYFVEGINTTGIK